MQSPSHGFTRKLYIVWDACFQAIARIATGEARNLIWHAIPLRIAANSD